MTRDSQKVLWLWNGVLRKHCISAIFTLVDTFTGMHLPESALVDTVFSPKKAYTIDTHVP